MKSNRLCIFGLAVFAMINQAPASPIGVPIGPDSEYLEEFGIDVEWQPSFYRDSIIQGYNFTIRIRKQKPVEEAPSFHASVTSYFTQKKHDSDIAVLFSGSEEDDLLARFMVDPKKMKRVRFTISGLKPVRLFILDLEAFAKDPRFNSIPPEKRPPADPGF